ncbi:aminotransferase class V-fold PLP-dependent enzyme [Allokutzneria sp. A3M-2-11 16]|uniref:pyridoxal phosphate-dependent decarboxylase family protein n=1 Tax=Allokutzneria sp. A3M-2-11 16 TaxID=2962043 RepID=UPI0020B742CE|nr:aminotransferase class V-fold PLP-dependent enzyme [Allokutzneria sp. A3M-2-11 16]MCP3804915.1 aminotransferase class V-fold PLP-dependent enzyme [Allokutzneria sp. A3M-2-11 16]
MLNLDEAERKKAGELLTAFFDDYERSIPERPLVPDVDRDALEALLAIPEEGIGVEGLFREINEKILPNSTTVAHPRFLAYVLGPPNGIAPYAEAIAATINQNCNFWQLSPAASVVERGVVAWLSALFGQGEHAGGILTEGGSIATLNAMTVALHARRPRFREQGLQMGERILVVYTSAEAHRCVDKAAAILGIGLDNVRRIPTDDQWRMRVDLLEKEIRADRAAGREPFCVVATPGTVTSGSIDPIADIADVCEREDLWLHVDGAYGGLFVLSEHKREEFQACGRADSIAVDPHKLLFAPLAAGCLLVRDRSTLTDAYAFSSSYLTVAEDALMIDYMDHGPQLSRGFKALKIWSALRTFGVGAFRAAMDHMLDLAQYMADLVDAERDLELMAPVSLTAVCFRMKHGKHAAALATLAGEGTALLGPASLGGQHGMRACVTNFRTTRHDVEQIVARLADVAGQARDD